MEVSEEADQDIDDISGHSENEAGFAVADRFLATIGQGLSHLSEFPKSGAIRFREDSALAELRVWLVPDFPYWMVYRETPTFVVIVRILHHQRDIPAILRRDLP